MSREGSIESDLHAVGGAHADYNATPATGSTARLLASGSRVTPAGMFAPPSKQGHLLLMNRNTGELVVSDDVAVSFFQRYFVPEERFSFPPRRLKV